MKIKPGVEGHDEEASSNGTNGHSAVPHEITISGDRLAEALQYGATAGLPGLVKVSLFTVFLSSRSVRTDFGIVSSSGWRLSRLKYTTEIKRPKIGG